MSTDIRDKKELIESIKEDYRKSKEENNSKRAKAPRVSRYDIRRALKIAMIAAMGLFGAPKLSAQNNYGNRDNVVEMSVDQIARAFGSQTTSYETYNTRRVRKAWEYSSAREYARDNGLEYSSRLSNGINRIGDDNFDGYAGAYVDRRNNEVVYLPNNMRDDSDYIRSYGIEHAKNMQSDFLNGVSGNGTGPYNHGGHAYNGVCPDRPVKRGVINHRPRNVNRGHGHVTPPRNNKTKRVVKGVVGGLLVLDAVLNSGR